MLTVTPAAARKIEDLTAPDEVMGLRVTRREDSPALTMGLVREPDDADTVVPAGRRGMAFLDPMVLPRRDDAVLDVKDEPGAAAFFLR